jgi:2-polyprenyl-3-methyl-5-hydroxy-6-metoxy-1,4-benzoquinol methylase
MRGKVKRKIKNFIKTGLSFRNLFFESELLSLERQVEKTVGKIRPDHTNRYEWVTSYLSFLKDENIKILDCFCGVGYGCNILSDFFKKATITGIDGSKETIDFANRFYSKNTIDYHIKRFPFNQEDKYDLVVSFESLEHVEPYKDFFKFLKKSLKNNGYLILSTPNESIIPYKEGDYKFHYRHFCISDYKELAYDYNLYIEKIFYQNSFTISNNKKVFLEKNKSYPFDHREGQNIIIVFKNKC